MIGLSGSNMLQSVAPDMLSRIIRSSYSLYFGSGSFPLKSVGCNLKLDVGVLKEIAEKPDKLPDVLKEDGYPDVQVFMATYRKAEAALEQYNRDLAAWERQVKEKRKPAKKEQAKPPERESVLKRLRQLQAEGKQRNQPRQRKKSFDRDSR
jgi:hypothetical protein